MNTDGAGELRKPRDRVFDFGLRNEHQVSQLIHHDHDIRQPVGRAFFLFRVPRFSLFEKLRLFHDRAAVESLDIAHPGLREDPVALFHFGDRPAQPDRHLLRIGNHRHHEVRQLIILSELHDLRINEHQPHLVRRPRHEQSRKDRIHADRFARAGGTRDQHVRHLRKVRHDFTPGHILAERKRQRRLARLPGVALHDFAQENHGRLGIRHLDTHDAFARNRGLHTNTFGLHRQRDIVAELRDFLHAHTRRGKQFVPGHDGAPLHVCNVHFHAELGERFLQNGSGSLEIARDRARRLGRKRIKQIQRGRTISGRRRRHHDGFRICRDRLPRLVLARHGNDGFLRLRLYRRCGRSGRRLDARRRNDHRGADRRLGFRRARAGCLLLFHHFFKALAPLGDLPLFPLNLRLLIATLGDHLIHLAIGRVAQERQLARENDRMDLDQHEDKGNQQPIHKDQAAHRAEESDQKPVSQKITDLAAATGKAKPSPQSFPRRNMHLEKDA